MQKYLNLLKQISLDNKYTKWYISIITSAPKQSEYYEYHHIIPKSFYLGGDKDENNIVKLTAKQHYICHLLLTKMFVGKFKSKMIYAYRGFVGVKNNKQEKRYNSKIYEFLKSKIKNRIKNIRLYKLERVKHIHPDEHNEIYNLIGEGWSLIMTDEYKPNRVGNMKGKKHSEESRAKMSNSSIKIRGRQTDEHRTNISKSLLGRVQPESEIANRASSLVKQYADGIRNSQGENNPNYGRRKIINIETKETLYIKLAELDNYIINGWELKR